MHGSSEEPRPEPDDRHENSGQTAHPAHSLDDEPVRAGAGAVPEPLADGHPGPVEAAASRADRESAPRSAPPAGMAQPAVPEPEPEPEPEPPPDLSGPFDARETLRRLARPRMSGSTGAALVTDAVRNRFDELGYTTDELPFTFSALPGRFALPAAGGIVTLLALFAAVLTAVGQPLIALGLLIAGAAGAALVAAFAIPAITRLPWGRQQGRNLYAHVQARRPRYIVMAHLDSKSQLVPLGLRAAAIALIGIGWLALLLLSLAALVQPVNGVLLFAAAVVIGLAGLVIVLSWADDQSPGALDNASGLTALLGLAERERDNGDVGFLVTDAEELGLAGARAAARQLPPVFGVINIDGIDDDGVFYVLERFGLQRKGMAPHIAAALLQAAEQQGAPIERRDLPRGILVDHVAIVQAGQPALTLMHGSAKSLNRVHRPGDSIHNLRGTAIDSAIELVAGALVVLRSQAPAVSAR